MKRRVDAVALIAFIGLMTFGIIAVQVELIAAHVHVVKGAVIVDRSPQVADMDSGQSLDAGSALSNKVTVRMTQDGVDPDNWGIVDVYRNAVNPRKQSSEPFVRLRAHTDGFQGARVTACLLQK